MQDNTETTSSEIDLNPALALEKLDAWLDGFIKILPNLIVAIILFIIFYFMAKFIKRLILKRFKSNDRANLGEVMSGFLKWVILIMGFMLCATIVVPSLKPGDLIAGLGVSSVAIGFAFKDILQNWLAGMLILLRQPFEIGDQIEVNDFEGTVEKIETRATLIKTYDNQKVVVPNSDIYTSAVKVKTAYESRRSEYDVGIGYADSIQQASTVITKAVSGVAGIDQNKIEVLPWDLAASWVTLRVRWWTDTSRAEVVKVHANVINAIKDALDDEGIDMPYDTKVHLLHDQTEETDGDRSQQREGWPAISENPKPKWKAEAKLQNEDSTGKSESDS